MASLKCKMCGGDLTVEPGMTVCECEYCGSRQTLPTADSEKKTNLFNRANRLRMNSEFDKASAVYEQIAAEFPEEAEAYWGLCLCNYGIEYVDDPATGKKLPTCHRTLTSSIMEDSNFEQACDNADAVARRVYRDEAKAIDRIQKDILSIAQNEAPYDVFICYKETAEDGSRTEDSVLAQDIYDALTSKGLKVFFSRITLEDKLGVQYEPYIYAALSSAKVMLAVGTRFEYYDAVWVKNEWSRFLSMMKTDKRKALIPCFKGLDAYDMPKEFKGLQAQDMAKLGWLQDLTHGVEKLCGRDNTVPQPAVQTVVQQVVSTGPNVDALLKRGYDALEDGAFEEAKTFFNDTLNSNAESAEAYLGLFMAEIKAENRSAAQSEYVAGNYTENRYWKRAKQYASGELAEALNTWENERNARLQREADAARRAKEEADRKAREAEEARRKKLEQIKKLQEQLRTGNFEFTAEEKAEQERLNAAAKSAEKAAADAENALAESSEVQEVARLEGLISAKRTQLAGLGFFKGKEKKELQAQIDTLEGILAETKKKVSAKQSEIDGLRKKAGNVEKEAEEYSGKVTEAKKKAVREQMFLVLGLDFSRKTIQFGYYEQGSGIEPIEWRVLERTEKGILLITEYAIDCKQYHKTCTDITWENCDLRKWLNQEFLKTALDEAEQCLIADTRCPADKNPKYATAAGNATTDKIFLLSIAEAEKYFSSDNDRMCAPTAYANAQGAYADDNYKTAAGKACCWWWLRSPGYASVNAARVNYDGSVDYGGYGVNNVYGCVRPALWINLGS